MRRSNLGREFNNTPPENYKHPEQQNRVQPADSKTGQRRSAAHQDTTEGESRTGTGGQKQQNSRTPETGTSRTAGSGNRASSRSRRQKVQQPAYAAQTQGGGHSHKKRMSHKMQVMLFVGISVLLLVAMFFLAMAYYNSQLQPRSSASKDILVTIPEGSSISETADILEKEGVIKNSMIFQSYAGRHSYGGQSIQAATYLLSPDMSVADIFTKLIDGDAYHGNEYKFTIPEGKNITEMSTIIADSGVCTADEFIAETKKLSDYMAKYPILDSIPADKVSQRTLEGYLFPDTYDVAVTSDQKGAEQVCNAMLERFTEVFNDDMIAQADKDGHTVDQIVIMASIVELETKLPEDRKDAASVFWNRIDQNMPLQSDITVDYALGTKTPVLTTEQVQSTDSPYNTYLNTGLPLGPICSPGEASLDAALNPNKTDYLYFVADMDTGKLHFNTTLEGHEADVQTYMGN